MNGSELKIDRDCENIFALFLSRSDRSSLSTGRIKDQFQPGAYRGYCRWHCQICDRQGVMAPFKAELLKASRILEMYDESVIILQDTQAAFEQEDTILARGVFKKDEFLDNVNLGATNILEKYLKDHPEDTLQALWILSIIRRLERVGDQSKNIAEEIIFYLEAKVLKHKGKHT